MAMLNNQVVVNVSHHWTMKTQMLGLPAGALNKNGYFKLD
jgi:hypothetical protein